MLNAYKQEMGIDSDWKGTEVKGIQELIAIFTKKRVQRIVFFEAIAVAFADGIYHEEQKEIIHKLKDAFSITDEDYEMFKTWLTKMNALYAQAAVLING